MPKVPQESSYTISLLPSFQFKALFKSLLLVRPSYSRYFQDPDPFLTLAFASIISDYEDTVQLRCT